jgi:hypothetical protein
LAKRIKRQTAVIDFRNPTQIEITFIFTHLRKWGVKETTTLAAKVKE